MRATDPPFHQGHPADLPGYDRLRGGVAGTRWAAPDPDRQMRAVGDRTDAGLLPPPHDPDGQRVERWPEGNSWRPPPGSEGVVSGPAEPPGPPVGVRAVAAVGGARRPAADNAVPSAAGPRARASLDPTRWFATAEAGAVGAESPVGVETARRGPGGVATWLPEGRWADPEEHGQEPAEAAAATLRGRRSDHRHDGDQRRRRGLRRVTGARLLARLAGWPRQVLAAALLLAAVVVALRPDAPTTWPAPQPVGRPVVVAARDLPAGTVLAKPDLRAASLPADLAPAGTARDVPALVGRTTAGAVRRGEAVTDVRLIGPGLTAGLGPRESSATPVRLADAEAAALVRAGDRVDVLGTPVDRTDAGTADAVEVATGVRVLAVLRGREAADGVVLVVASAPEVARRLAGAAGRHRLTVTVRPP